MMTERLTRLVLFDIDGTILRSNGAGRRAMLAALRDVFGTPGPKTTATTARPIRRSFAR